MKNVNLITLGAGVLIGFGACLLYKTLTAPAASPAPAPSALPPVPPQQQQQPSFVPQNPEVLEV
jgi:hypothetical protein